MVKTGKGKIIDRGDKYPKIHLYIPTGVYKDSAFPFKVGEDVSVTIEDGRLVIDKREPGS